MTVNPPTHTDISDEAKAAAFEVLCDWMYPDRPEGGCTVHAEMLAAAIPHVEAAIREKIAAEFEARDVPGLHWVIALEEAAAVARGGQK